MILQSCGKRNGRLRGGSVTGSGEKKRREDNDRVGHARFAVRGVGGLGRRAEGQKNIGFYGDFHRRMQNKHNSVYPGFIGLRGRCRVTKAVKWPFYLSSVLSPRLLRNDVSEVFELRHYAAVMWTRTSAARIAMARGDVGGGCCSYFRTPRKFSLLFILLYLYKFVYYFPRYA